MSSTDYIDPEILGYIDMPITDDAFIEYLVSRLNTANFQSKIWRTQDISRELNYLNQKYGLTSLGVLSMISENDLLQFDRIGAKNIQLIKQILSFFGLQLSGVDRIINFSGVIPLKHAILLIAKEVYDLDALSHRNYEEVLEWGSLIKLDTTPTFKDSLLSLYQKLKVTHPDCTFVKTFDVTIPEQ